MLRAGTLLAQRFGPIWLDKPARDWRIPVDAFGVVRQTKSLATGFLYTHAGRATTFILSSICVAFIAGRQIGIQSVSHNAACLIGHKLLLGFAGVARHL